MLPAEAATADWAWAAVDRADRAAHAEPTGVQHLVGEEVLSPADELRPLVGGEQNAVGERDGRGVMAATRVDLEAAHGLPPRSTGRLVVDAPVAEEGAQRFQHGSVACCHLHGEDEADAFRTVGVDALTTGGEGSLAGDDAAEEEPDTTECRTPGTESVELMRLELTTPCMPCRCSSQLSYSPVSGREITNPRTDRLKGDADG